MSSAAVVIGALRVYTNENKKRNVPFLMEFFEKNVCDNVFKLHHPTARKFGASLNFRK